MFDWLTSLESDSSSRFWLIVASQVICAVIAIVVIKLFRSPKRKPRPSVDDVDNDKTIRPFKIAIPEEDLKDLAERLSIPRYPDQLDELGWTHGTNLIYLQKLVEYWKNTFDWRKQEELLNSFSHFKTTIDGKEIHFIHQRSQNPKVIRFRSKNYIYKLLFWCRHYL